MTDCVFLLLTQPRWTKMDISTVNITSRWSTSLNKIVHFTTPDKKMCYKTMAKLAPPVDHINAICVPTTLTTNTYCYIVQVTTENGAWFSNGETSTPTDHINTISTPKTLTTIHTVSTQSTLPVRVVRESAMERVAPPVVATSVTENTSLPSSSMSCSECTVKVPSRTPGR